MSEAPTETSPQPSSPQAGGFRNSGNFYVLIFGTVMLVGLVALAWIGRPPRPKFVGEKLPLIDLQPLLYTDTPLANAQLENKLVVLHFWGTWCPPCRAEYPEFAAFAKKYSESSDVIVASVSCSAGVELDLERLRSDTEKFMEENGGAIPTYCDSTAMSRQQFAMLSPVGSFGYPTTVVADRSGNIIDAYLGPANMRRLEEMIENNL
ncbi:MAG: TlpA disulfide reductase family protein [Planctomycetota bacterium]